VCVSLSLSVSVSLCVYVSGQALGVLLKSEGLTSLLFNAFLRTVSQSVEEGDEGAINRTNDSETSPSSKKGITYDMFAKGITSVSLSASEKSCDQSMRNIFRMIDVTSSGNAPPSYLSLSLCVCMCECVCVCVCSF